MDGPYGRQWLCEMGRQIQAVRRRRRTRQQDVADEVGCARGTISRTEAGAYGTYVSTLAAIAGSLGVGVGVLTDLRPEHGLPPQRAVTALRRRLQDAAAAGSRRVRLGEQDAAVLLLALRLVYPEDEGGPRS